MAVEFVIPTRPLTTVKWRSKQTEIKHINAPLSEDIKVKSLEFTLYNKPNLCSYGGIKFWLMLKKALLCIKFLYV